MSWSTELFCNISYNRVTYNSKSEVEGRIAEVNKDIESCEKVIRDMSLMTEPAKYAGKDEDPYYFVTERVEEALNEIEEYLIEKYKLSILLDNWENCHNKEGLAIYPPDDMDYDTAYLHGDFVHSTKYPDNKSLL